MKIAIAAVLADYAQIAEVQRLVSVSFESLRYSINSSPCQLEQLTRTSLFLFLLPPLRATQAIALNLPG
jgi:hypothetical protein